MGRHSPREGCDPRADTKPCRGGQKLFAGRVRTQGSGVRLSAARFVSDVDHDMVEFRSKLGAQGSDFDDVLCFRCRFGPQRRCGGSRPEPTDRVGTSNIGPSATIGAGQKKVWSKSLSLERPCSSEILADCPAMDEPLTLPPAMDGSRRHQRMA